MPPAGNLRDRLRFERQTAFSGNPLDGGDGAGNFRTDVWVTEFACWAEVKAKIGGEAVMAERLQGRQPVEITVRHARETLRITSDWRAVDRDGVVYQVKSPPVDRDRRRQWLTMAAESGVAA